MLKKVKAFDVKTNRDKFGRTTKEAVLNTASEIYLNTGLINFIFPFQKEEKSLWRLELSDGDTMFTEPFEV